MHRLPMLHGNGFAVSRDLNPKLVSVDALKPLGRQTRKHPPLRFASSAKASSSSASSCRSSSTPRIASSAAGALVLAARKIGLGEVPAVIVDDLDEAKLRLLRLALNRLGEELSWDVDALKLEFSDVLEITSDIDLRISGFEMGEIDVALSCVGRGRRGRLPALNETEPPVTQPGDLWMLGDHRMLCGDALAAESYVRLLGDERAQMVFTDPPWNIPIAGNVSGLGAVKHDDFAMACGEMTEAQFEAFLRTSLGHAAAYSDRRLDPIRLHALVEDAGDAGRQLQMLYAELKNLCVWNKTNAGMGSLYRSQHELVFVFKKGNAPHINNVELGRFGRNRTNVWDYPRPERFQRHGQEQAVAAPDRKAGRARRRRDPRLFAPQRDHPRSVRRRRLHFDRRREDRAQGAPDRDSIRAMSMRPSGVGKRSPAGRAVKMRRPTVPRPEVVRVRATTPSASDGAKHRSAMEARHDRRAAPPKTARSATSARRHRPVSERASPAIRAAGRRAFATSPPTSSVAGSPGHLERPGPGEAGFDAGGALHAAAGESPQRRQSRP